MTKDERGEIDHLEGQLRRIVAILQAHRDGKRADLESPPADNDATLLKSFVAAFGLSPFERDVLLLCAGIELDARCAKLVSELQAGSPPNFALALAALPGAHWSATLPNAPLRRWGLVNLAEGPSLIGAALRIDERILHHLIGLDPLDATLAVIIEPARPAGQIALPHLVVSNRIAEILGPSYAESGIMTVELVGNDRRAAREIATDAALRLSVDLFAVSARDLTDDVAAIDRFSRIWSREARLAPRLLMVTGEGEGIEDRVRRLVDRTNVPLLLVGLHQPIDAASPVLRIDIPQLALPGQMQC